MLRNTSGKNSFSANIFPLLTRATNDRETIQTNCANVITVIWKRYLLSLGMKLDAILFRFLSFHTQRRRFRKAIVFLPLCLSLSFLSAEYIGNSSLLDNGRPLKSRGRFPTKICDNAAARLGSLSANRAR